MNQQKIKSMTAEAISHHKPIPIYIKLACIGRETLPLKMTA